MRYFYFMKMTKRTTPSGKVIFEPYTGMYQKGKTVAEAIINLANEIPEAFQLHAPAITWSETTREEANKALGKEVFPLED